MNKRYLVLLDGQPLAYCTIVLNDKILMITSGSIDTSGRKQIRDSQSKLFDTKQIAKSTYDELVQQKLDEGFKDAQDASSGKPTANTKDLKTESMVLSYDEANVPYSAAEAQFDLSNDRLDIYIQLEIGIEEAEWPPEILIRFSNLKFDEQNQTLQIFDEHTDWDEPAYDDKPYGYIYSGFHHRKVSAWMEIKAHDEEEMVAFVKIVTDDVIRYNDKAKDNEISGICTMKRSSKNDMWAP